VHVARPPEPHDFWPDIQLLAQLSEQLALGAIPEHDIGELHPADAAT
jgi:hypothetical protein